MAERLMASGRRLAQSEVRRFVKLVAQQEPYAGSGDAMEMALEDFLDRRLVRKQVKLPASSPGAP